MSADLTMAEPNPIPTIRPDDNVKSRDFQNNPITTVRLSRQEETPVTPTAPKSESLQKKSPADQPETEFRATIESEPVQTFGKLQYTRFYSQKWTLDADPTATASKDTIQQQKKPAMDPTHSAEYKPTAEVQSRLASNGSRYSEYSTPI